VRDVSWSDGTCVGVDQCAPWSVEYDSQPMSFPAHWVSHTAYTFPAESMAMLPLDSS